MCVYGDDYAPQCGIAMLIPMVPPFCLCVTLYIIKYIDECACGCNCVSVVMNAPLLSCSSDTPSYIYRNSLSVSLFLTQSVLL